MHATHPATVLLLITGLTLFWLLPLSAWWMLQGRQDAKARLWFAGTAAYALVISIFAITRPDSGSVAYAAMFLFSLLGNLLMIEALRQEVGTRSVPASLYWGLLALGIALILLVLFVFEDEYLGRVIFLAQQGALQFVLIMLALRIKRIFASRALDVVILAFGLHLLNNLARIVEWAVLGHAQPVLAFTVLTNIAVVLNLLGVVFYSFGYWGFALEKARRQVETSAQQVLDAVEREKDAQYQAALAAERERLLAQMVELGRLAQAGALSASIAHEINQPLASVRLSMETALATLDGASDQPRLRRMLQRAVEENTRAAQIIQRIRNLFRGDASPLELKVVDDVIKRALHLLRPNRKAQGVTITASLAAPLPIPIADGELEHVLINLIDNALDAVNAAPGISRQIAISSEQNQEVTRIRISDNGLGVPPDVRETLFDLAVSTKQQGMGMGLWLAQHIVERHYGRLFLTDNPGGGSTFTVELPVRALPVR